MVVLKLMVDYSTCCHNIEVLALEFDTWYLLGFLYFVLLLLPLGQFPPTQCLWNHECHWEPTPQVTPWKSEFSVGKQRKN